jgi:hypothetical protein
VRDTVILSRADLAFLRSLPQRVSYHPLNGTDRAMRSRIIRLQQARMISTRVLDTAMPGLSHAEIVLTENGRIVLDAFNV